ncbi:hypothetical protein ACS0TY_016223 [Phlomoides rotata]
MANLFGGVFGWRADPGSTQMCIDTWLVSNGLCLNCRVSLVEPPPSSGGAPLHRVVVNIWSQ